MGGCVPSMGGPSAEDTKEIGETVNSKVEEFKKKYESAYDDIWWERYRANQDRESEEARAEMDKEAKKRAGSGELKDMIKQETHNIVWPKISAKAPDNEMAQKAAEKGTDMAIGKAVDKAVDEAMEKAAAAAKTRPDPKQQ